MRYFFEHSISRPPTAREREVLTLRLARLKAMEQSAVDATAKLQELVEHRASPPGICGFVTSSSGCPTHPALLT